VRLIKSFIGVTILMIGCQSASAFVGDCYLSVQGKVYEDGPCEIMLQPGGSFSIGAGNAARSRFFAYVDLDQTAGTARGYWNGTEAASHAHEELGSLLRSGGCWANGEAKVCAWRPGTRPPRF
jgi:hypothetical protein